MHATFDSASFPDPASSEGFSSAKLDDLMVGSTAFGILLLSGSVLISSAGQSIGYKSDKKALI